MHGLERSREGDVRAENLCCSSGYAGPGPVHVQNAYGIILSYNIMDLFGLKRQLEITWAQVSLALMKQRENDNISQMEPEDSTMHSDLSCT